LSGAARCMSSNLEKTLKLTFLRLVYLMALSVKIFMLVNYLIMAKTYGA
jgi:hypothetical protein